MWIIDFIKWQFIDVINWENPESFLLVKKFDRPLDEIKNNSTLIVDPWYAAIFVHNGKIEAIQETPWKRSLDTENVPFITSFKNIMRWLESQDKAAVYFAKITEITNQKWWTKNPVKYVDPVYNFPIKLRAFGNFTFKIVDIEKYRTWFVGTKAELTVDEVTNLLTDRMLQYLTDSFAENWFSYIEIDSKRVELANSIMQKINENIWDLWLEITDFRLEDTNFTEETESLIAKISEQTANVHSMNQLKDVDQTAMSNYKTTKQLDAMEKAAWNEWTAWAMMWSFVGMNMWQNLNTQVAVWNEPQDNLETKLLQLKSLLEKDLISKQEYEQKKKDLLKWF